VSTVRTATKTLDELCVDTIRTLSMDAVQCANSGHPGTPMALAPLAYVLYTRVMRHNPFDPTWPDRDRFVLSAGHASMLLYSTLYLTGYDLSLDDLKRFRQLESATPGHPEYGHTPGVEVTTGPLGQGIANAVGFALGERMLAARFNRPNHDIVDHYTFAIASDGDLQEGISSEACSLAGHLGLGRLIVFFDNNHVQLSGRTSLAWSEDVGRRFDAFGWSVQDIGENIGLDVLERATRTAMEDEDRPSLIVLRTHIGYGSPNKQDTYHAHGSPLGEEEVSLTKQAYGWPSDEPFYVPEEALDRFRRLADVGQKLHLEWKERFAAYRKQHGDAAAEFERLVARRLPDRWDADIPRFRPESGMIATRKASNEVIQWAAARVPELVGGAADLAPSTLTTIADGGDVQRGAYDGRNLHFGVREHAMAAIVNGLVLHYFRAYGGTFLNFLDYMKPAVRLAALMKIPSIFVFTHDSIGLGEDGPTHQPVEQLAHMRAVPNLYCVRPAGANETALAWRFAITRTDAPVALVFSRQGLPMWNPAGVPDDAVERGAYVLRDSFREPDDPDLILLATGSEVHICTRAADLLEADGLATRVVSVPCADRFAEQELAYRNKVLPPRVRARVSVEAAATLGWDRWITDDGDCIGLDRFGASAPQPDLYERFGFTPRNVAHRGRAVVERLRQKGGEAR
jgi:transketolase